MHERYVIIERIANYKKYNKMLIILLKISISLVSDFIVKTSEVIPVSTSIF